MKKQIVYSFIIAVFVSTFSYAQDAGSKPKKRARVVVTENIAAATPTPTPKRVIIVPSATPGSYSPPKARTSKSPTPARRTYPGSQARTLRYIELQRKIDEAKRRMRSKPLRISYNDPVQTTSIVRIAFYDWNSRRIDYAVISKPLFLTRGNNSLVRSESGKTVRVYTIRGNGVNTPVMVYDSYGRAQLPLVVQYPIEKYGRFREMSYYISTHPGNGTPEVVNVGRTYVRNVLDIARQKLRSKGIFIQPRIVDVAEKLALLEHVDHTRFRTEYHPRIYNDVYTLYALNKGQTYRYSVSRAGAGGMVQMIPATYRMIRSRYYRVGLIPDFVTGMRNHSNAAQAMLLYMQMTWNDLIANSTVRSAMQRGWATQAQLMAAGYNSNPARLPRYIRRGGANWKAYIPRETKVYLRILASIERYVPMRSRAE